MSSLADERALTFSLQRMLYLPDDGLDGDGQRIFLFPAWPRQWDVSFKFLAQNQTSVQGELVGGKLQSLIVTPESRRKDVINLLKSDDEKRNLLAGRAGREL